MPSLRAGRPKDEGHEATDEDCSEDEISLPSLFDPNEKDDTTYGVLDDFFDKFGGGTSKTQEDNAALMADEKTRKPLILRSGWGTPVRVRMFVWTVIT